MFAFQKRLAALEHEIGNTEGRVPVARGFNAGALERGIPQPNSQGTHILEMAARTRLIVLNMTYCCEGTIADVIFAAESLESTVQIRKVLEDFDIYC